MTRRTAKRQRKAVPPPSHRPWAAVELAIDSATTSGWSIWCSGRHVSSGECGPIIADIRKVVAEALELAATAKLPCVLVLERPFGQKPGRAFGGSGKGRELWKAVWRDCGGVLARVVQVYPSVWRSKVLGKGQGNMKHDQVRPVEQRAAVHIIVDQSMDSRLAMSRLGPDECAAVCIGFWASKSGEVGACLPAKLRRVA